MHTKSMIKHTSEIASEIVAKNERKRDRETESDEKKSIERLAESRSGDWQVAGGNRQDESRTRFLWHFSA